MELVRAREILGLSQRALATRLDVSLRTVQRWESGASSTPKSVIQLLRADIGSNPKSQARDFTFIDLFAGIGGMRRGFEGAGGRCVFTSEWDMYAQRTYRANFGAQHPIAGDITLIPSAAIPAHDVLLAGFPCQPFSIAGVSKKNSLGRPHGFACETQGTLFFDVARILEYHRPKAFLLENVKNLRTHDRGRTFETILRVLVKELGYNVTWRVVDARAYVPQHRERILIAGFRDAVGFDINTADFRPPAAGPKLGAILHPEDGSEPAEDAYLNRDGSVKAKYVLTDNLWQYLQNYAAKHRERGNGFGYGLFTPNDVGRTLSARYYKDGSELLIDRSGDTPRRLTPRECARLMGFDDDFSHKFSIPVSDTQAYKQFGNSVVVPVIREVAGAMAPYVRNPAAMREQLVLPLPRSA